MRLKYEFEKMNLDGEDIAVPVGAGSKDLHFILKLNETGSRILDILRDDVSEGEIAARLSEEYAVDGVDAANCADVTDGTDVASGVDIAGCVAEFIGKLREAGVIAE